MWMNHHFRALLISSLHLRFIPSLPLLSIHLFVLPPPPRVLPTSPRSNVPRLPRGFAPPPTRLRSPDWSSRRPLSSESRDSDRFSTCPPAQNPWQGTWIIPACIGPDCSPTSSQQEKARRRIGWKRSALNYLMRSQPANQSEAANSLM